MDDAKNVQASHVLIDERALNQIKDTAHGVFKHHIGRVADTNLLMFEALAQYLSQRGVNVPFTVVLK